MPSGSHGGGSGGSHGGFSGGGFSRGGSSFGSSRGQSFRPRGPRTVIFFGRPVILTSARQILLSIILMFGFFVVLATFAFGTSISSAKDHLKMIEEEQRYYLQMVADAELDPSLQTVGKVKAVYYQDDYDKYYIEYYLYDETGRSYEGYSFSVYNLTNAPKKGSEILLAVDDADIDSTTDSVPMDYKNFTLEDDGEYMLYKSRLKYYTTGTVVLIIVIVALIGGCILVVATAKRKKEEQEEAEKKEQTKKAEEAQRKKFCQYCGNRVNETDRNCPQCGARLL